MSLATSHSPLFAAQRTAPWLRRPQLDSLLTERGMTREDLASHCGVSAERIDSWLSETTRPPLSRLHHLTRALDAPLSDLVLPETGRLHIYRLENSDFTAASRRSALSLAHHLLRLVPFLQPAVPATSPVHASAPTSSSGELLNVLARQGVVVVPLLPGHRRWLRPGRFLVDTRSGYAFVTLPLDADGTVPTLLLRRAVELASEVNFTPASTVGGNSGYDKSFEAAAAHFSMGRAKQVWTGDFTVFAALARWQRTHGARSPHTVGSCLRLDPAGAVAVSLALWANADSAG